MATFRKTYSNGSTSRGTTSKCVELTNKSRSQSEISPNIPDYSILNNVIISFQWRTDKSLTAGDCQVYINKSPDDYMSWDDSPNQIGSTSNAKNSFVSVYVDKNTSIKDISTRLPDFFNSGKKNVGEYSGSYSVCVWFSASIMRNFYWQNMYMEFDYTPPTFVISLTAGTGGTVSGAGTYQVGTSATIKATPNTGYRFVKWSDGNTSATRTITKTTSDISANVTNLSYSAVFEKITYTLTTSVSPDGTGTVSGGGTYEAGKTATLVATASAGYKFKQWSDGVTTATRTVSVTGNATYTAIFEVDKINKIYVGTAQTKAIYVGTQEVKAIYVGTTKVYG